MTKCRLSSCIQSIDYMDSPNKYAIGKKIIGSLVEKKRVDAVDVKKALDDTAMIDELSFSAKKLQ